MICVHIHLSLSQRVTCLMYCLLGSGNVGTCRDDICMVGSVLVMLFHYQVQCDAIPF